MLMAVALVSNMHEYVNLYMCVYVYMQFKRSLWNVVTGRQDGRVSLASEAVRDLPSAGANFTTLQQQFAANGLDVTDLVALSGILYFIIL